MATETRKAWAAVEQGKPLQEFTYTVGPLGANEVDIKVTHNGVCHSDYSMRENEWGISAFPFVPGHEVVGVVAAVGSSVKGLAPGDRVGVGWNKDSCRSCSNCIKGEENLCKSGTSGLIVMGGYGGFQDVLRLNPEFVFKLPERLDSADAAPLLCAGVTVYAPLRRLVRFPGTRVAVLGVGGLGHLGIQFAAAMGADVTAIGSTPAKEAEAKSLGASTFFTLDQALANHATFDVVLNTAPANVPAASLMALLANDGSLVQIGIPSGKLEISLTDLVFGQKRVEGSVGAGRRDMNEMLNFAAVKGIKPMLELMPLSQVNEALQRVHENKVRYRIVLTRDY